MFIKDIDTVLKTGFSPPNYDLSSFVIEIICVFSVVKSYVLLDCYAESLYLLSLMHLHFRET